MDTRKILVELHAERTRIDSAIKALEQISIGIAPVKNGRPSAGTHSVQRPRRTMSAAARKRISEAAKARWAARKQGGTNLKKTATKKAVLARGGMSASARKRMSEMMKKRWAERKKAAQTA